MNFISHCWDTNLGETMCQIWKGFYIYTFIQTMAKNEESVIGITNQTENKRMPTSLF